MAPGGQVVQVSGGHLGSPGVVYTHTKRTEGLVDIDRSPCPVGRYADVGIASVMPRPS
jgi:hypothetical protein